MILPDNKIDSLLVYCDWLEDNQQEELATEIRQEETKVTDWSWEDSLNASKVGSLSISAVGVISHMGHPRNLTLDTSVGGRYFGICGRNVGIA